MDISFEDYIDFKFRADKKLVLEDYNFLRIKDFLMDYNFKNFSKVKGLDEAKALKILLIKEAHLSIKK